MSHFMSVVVCTYKRPEMIKRFLSSMSRQSIPDNEFEIIVVTDKNEGETAEVCQAEQKNRPNMKIVTSNGYTTLAEAANLGIQAARGDRIIFTDDDCIPQKEWAAHMRQALEQSPIVAGAIDSPASNFLKLCHNINHFHRFMVGQKPGFINFMAGANMGFRREVLEELNGFKEDSQNPDMELCLRAQENGYKIYFEPEAVITHNPVRARLGEIFRYAAHLASTSVLLRRQFRALLKTPFVLRSPFLLLLASPVIALKVTVCIYTRNVRFVKMLHTAPLVYALKLAWCWGAARGLISK